MSAAAVLAILFFLFFGVGVGVGALVVFAMSARRAHQAVSQARPADAPRGTWPFLPGHDPDEGGPYEGSTNEPPWWQARSGD
jgi:hypothetical protein